MRQNLKRRTSSIREETHYQGAPAEMRPDGRSQEGDVVNDPDRVGGRLRRLGGVSERSGQFARDMHGQDRIIAAVGRGQLSGGGRLRSRQVRTAADLGPKLLRLTPPFSATKTDGTPGHRDPTRGDQ